MATAPLDVQKILVLGREKLLRGIMCNTYGWLADDRYIPHASCKKPTLCAAARVKRLSQVCFPIPDLNHALDKWNQVQHAADLCDTCAKEAEIRHLVGRRDFWSELPSYFGLPDWENLTYSTT